MPPEITARDLITRIEDEDDIHVLDVRAPERLANGSIDLLPPARFHNVRGSEVMGADDPARIGIPRQAPVAVVCGRGNDSRVISEMLRGKGFRAASLSGGMIAWMELVVPRELAPPPGCERFVQFDRIGKGSLGYVVVSGGEALVVDPPRHTAAIREVLRETGARVVAVADTHAHADYISGGPALADELGVPYRLHAADSVYPYDGTPGKLRFEPVEGGERIHLGDVTVTVEHTPGHTEGSVCYRIGNDAVMTGDFVFVESVGRPDLGGKAEEWTAVLWESLERARTAWPADIRVFPAHYATGSERNADRTVGRAFGELPRANRPLSLDGREAFTAWILGKTGSFPEAYRRIKAINVGLETPSEEEMVELEAGRNQCALG